jgi:hypothetical protein
MAKSVSAVFENVGHTPDPHLHLRASEAVRRIAAAFGLLLVEVRQEPPDERRRLTRRQNP